MILLTFMTAENSTISQDCGGTKSWLVIWTTENERIFEEIQQQQKDKKEQDEEDLKG